MDDEDLYEDAYSKKKPKKTENKQTQSTIPPRLYHKTKPNVEKKTSLEKVVSSVVPAVVPYVQSLTDNIISAVVPSSNVKSSSEKSSKHEQPVEKSTNHPLESVKEKFVNQSPEKMLDSQMLSVFSGVFPPLPLKPPVEKPKMVDSPVLAVFSTTVPSTIIQSTADKSSQYSTLKKKLYQTPISVLNLQNSLIDVDSNKDYNDPKDPKRADLVSAKSSTKTLHDTNYSQYGSTTDNKMTNTASSHHQNENYVDPTQTVTLVSHDYLWVRKGTACLIILVLMVLLLVSGFIIYYAFACHHDTIPVQQCEGKSKKERHQKQLKAKEAYKDFDLVPELNPLISPTEYYVYLSTAINSIPNNFTFYGHVNIMMYVNDMTNKIFIHFVNLKLLNDPILIGPNTQHYGISSIKLNEETEMMELHLKQTTIIGEYNLSVSYYGVIDLDTHGFYRVPYKSSDSNATEWLLLTNFKPNGARTMIPCFDDPRFKASFNVFIKCDRDMYPYTTTKLMDQGGASRRMRRFNVYNIDKWYRYVKTPPMLTSSLAISLMTYKDFVRTYEIDNPVLMYSLYVHRTIDVGPVMFAYNSAINTVKYLEKYFNRKMLLSHDKLDTIIVPNYNFDGIGSMGLFFLSEKHSIFIQGLYSVDHRKIITLAVAHRLVQQWFGNDITISTWEDEWLFEGFAIHMKYKALHNAYPNCNSVGHFFIDYMQPLLLMESLTADSSEFSDSNYEPSSEKGAVILRMFEHIIKDQTFDSAMQKLAVDKKLSSVNYDDICEMLTKFANSNGTLSVEISLCSILDQYAYQKGYPVLKLNRNYVTNKGIITQEQFKLTGDTQTVHIEFAEDEDQNMYWDIPISVATRADEFEDTQPKFWLPAKREHVLDFMPSRNWIILNVQFTGLYRVNYDKRNWRMIEKQLHTNHLEIHELNRAQIIDDVLNLARASMVDYNLALDIITYLVNETEYVPLRAAFHNFEYLDMMISKSAEYDSYKDFILVLIQNKVALRSKKSKSIIHVMLHKLILKWACYVGDPKCLNYCKELFPKFMEIQKECNDTGAKCTDAKYNPIPFENRYVVYCNAIRMGSKIEWDFLWQIYLHNVFDQAQRIIILKSLACSREPWILNRFLWRLVQCHDYGPIPPTFYSIVVTHISRNPIGRKIALDFVLTNWDLLTERHKSREFFLKIFRSICLYVNIETELATITDWIYTQETNIPFLSESFQQLNEVIQNNIFFMVTCRWQIIRWIQNYLDSLHDPVDRSYVDVEENEDKYREENEDKNRGEYEDKNTEENEEKNREEIVTDNLLVINENTTRNSDIEIIEGVEPKPFTITKSNIPKQYLRSFRLNTVAHNDIENTTVTLNKAKENTFLKDLIEKFSDISSNSSENVFVNV